MGCDIWTSAQARGPDGKWVECAGDYQKGKFCMPFDWRQYGMFAFLAGVRNRWNVPTIAPPRGLPDDMPDEYGPICASIDDDEPFKRDNWIGDHSFTWLTVGELVSFDYNQTFPSPEKGGTITSLREFLGPDFFLDLEALKASGAERVVMGFDS